MYVQLQITLNLNFMSTFKHWKFHRHGRCSFYVMYTIWERSHICENITNNRIEWLLYLFSSFPFFFSHVVTSARLKTINDTNYIFLTKPANMYLKQQTIYIIALVKEKINNIPKTFFDVWGLMIAAPVLSGRLMHVQS